MHRRQGKKREVHGEPEEWPGPKKWSFIYLELLDPKTMLTVHDKLTCFYNQSKAFTHSTDTEYF